MLKAAAEAGIGLLRGLHHAVLRGTQFLRMLLQQRLQLASAALAQLRQALALLEQQAQERQRQPDASRGWRRCRGNRCRRQPLSGSAMLCHSSGADCAGASMRIIWPPSSSVARLRRCAGSKVCRAYIGGWRAVRRVRAR